MSAALEEDETRLWQEWHGSRQPALRQQLVERYLWLPRAVAFQVMRGRAPHGTIEHRELVQLASVGLLEAVDTFDPQRGVRFAQYASKRVRGAVLDGLEQLSEYQAQAALRRRVNRERAESLARQDGAGGLFEEMVDVAVGLAIGYMLEDTALYADGSRSGGDPYEASETLLLGEQLKYLVEGLAEQERLVIRYHYYHELPFKDVAELLDLSKGRISQIHSKALAEIRRRYAALGGFELRG